MNGIRLLFTTIEIACCITAVRLGEEGHPVAGVLVALAGMLLAYHEGFHRWGSSN